MKVLVVGGGGREHALVWKLRQSPEVEQVYCAPGNAGIALEASCIPADMDSQDEVANLAETLQAALVVVGPEAPLVSGLADALASRGIPVVGPSRRAAQLEGSKAFAKRFMAQAGIPTADFAVVRQLEDLDPALDKLGLPVALKADGLAAGKGVVAARDRREATTAAQAMLSGEMAGGAGRTLVVEQFLEGEEVSFIVVSDGESFYAFPPAQDHKPVFDGDQGPNTGGMGAYCDQRILSGEQRQRILASVIEPALDGLRRDGTPFRGFLYAGLMMTADGPRVLEFNVRLGDPEAQPLLYAMDGDFGAFLRTASAGKLDASAISWPDDPSVCVVLASEGYPGAYPKGRPIEGISGAEAAGCKVFHAGTRFHGGRLVTSGGRVLGVTAQAADLPQAIHKAYEGVAQVRFQGMHCRRDIGKKGLHRWSK